MFHTAVFSKTLQNGVFMTEWMTWDLKDSLVIESHKCCYLQHCQKKTVPHPAHYSDIHEIFKLPRRTADICKALSINKALEYALPCAQYVKGSAELYENAAQLYEAAVKLELR